MYGLFPLPGTGPCASNPLTACASSTYNNDADRALLTQPVNSAQVMQHEAAAGVPNGGYLLPYLSANPQTLLSTAIKPYSQFPNLGPSGSATGDSLYNSLQAKATKRFSHNLQAGGSFTWAKGFTRAARQSDFFNPENSVWDLQNIPFRTLNFNVIYMVPRASFLNKWENLITEGWQVGFFGNYQTGMLLPPPGNYQTSEQVNGEEFYTGQAFYAQGVDINNHSTFNPYSTPVLNPGAWAPCPVNTACPASGTLYPGFRGPRQPVENANIGHNFRIKERMNFQIRGEFVNIFNRTIFPNPNTFYPQSPVAYGGIVNGAKVLTSGFGVINAYAAPSTAPPQGPNGIAPVFAPRTGTVIARFTF
jgi:hypothetical protein